MVPVDSDGVSPAPPYSGYFYYYKHYLYGTITLYGLNFHPVLIQFITDIEVLQPLSCRNTIGLG